MKRRKAGRILVTALLIAVMIWEPMAGVPVVYAVQEDEGVMVPAEESEDNTVTPAEETGDDSDKSQEEENAETLSEEEQEDVEEASEEDEGAPEQEEMSASDEEAEDAEDEAAGDFISFQIDGGDIVGESEVDVDGSTIKWKIDASGTLIVTGTGEYALYAGNMSQTEAPSRAPWYSYRSSIKAANINVTDINDLSYMFNDCENLTTVNLSGLDTSKVSDMEHMFQNCKKLSRVDLSGFNTSDLINMSYMFKDCSALETLDISSFTANGSGMEKALYMTGAFEGCSKLKSLTIGAGDMGQGVVNTACMFNGCTSLVKLDLTHFIPNNVTEMNNMFTSCTSLTKLTFDERFTASAATNMTGLFQSCTSLVSVNLGKWNTAAVVVMNSMFYDCSALTGLDLSSFNTSSVEDMRYLFKGCSALKNLDLSKFNTSKVTDMYGMFYDCSGLESLNISGFDTSHITKMDYLFRGCSKLTGLDLSSFDTSNVTDMAGMFCDCSSLTSLNVSNFRTSKVTDMTSMFFGCSALVSLDVSSFDTSSLTKCDYMFCNCIKMKELDMRSFNLSNCTSAEGILNSGTTNIALATVYAPRYLKSSVKLPIAKYTDKWYDSDGKEYKNLPVNSAYSIMLCRNKKPEPVQSAIRATKTKTVYLCGEVLNTDDIVVVYDDNGALTKLSEGEYSTDASEIDMSTPGKKILTVTYVDKNNNTLKAEIEIRVVRPLDQSVSITMQEGPYTYTGYPVRPQVTSVTVIEAGKIVGLKKDTDYIVSYLNNIHAGENTAKLIVEGAGDYTGSVELAFSIEKAVLTFAADSATVIVGEPWEKGIRYSIEGLQGRDTEDYALTKKPVCTVKKKDGTEITQTDAATTEGDKGVYTVTPEGAVANGDYEIGGYRAGTLTVAEEKIVYTVTFDLLSHKDDVTTETVPNDIAGVKAGSLIDAPDEPVLKLGTGNYLFKGWYRDIACTKAWDFASDMVQGDLTLYACWAEAPGASGPQFVLQEIQDQYYTGSAIKPAIAVYTEDGSTRLKAGKDYTIASYKNNIDTDVKAASGNEFDAGLPYVVIKGKGNYSGTVNRNFHIRQAVISDGTEVTGKVDNDRRADNQPASGITLKYADQLVINASKAQKPFTSIKYKKAMKVGTDFTLSLTAVSAWKITDSSTGSGKIYTAVDRGVGFDQSGNEIKTGEKNLSVCPVVPKNYYGTFKLTIKGVGNYTGIITKTIHVVENKKNLIKNASVTLGADIKKVPFKGQPVILDAAIVRTEVVDGRNVGVYYKTGIEEADDEKLENGKGIFTVKSGNTYLRCGRDYTVRYTNNAAVGTATMTIIGMGEYAGKKSVTFKITGTPFNTKNIMLTEAAENSAAGDAKLFWKFLTYTGKPLTQNGVVLSVAQDGLTRDGKALVRGEALVYGEDYTIAYKNNVKKGTATMTFTARPASGWTGSFKKTFKITAAGISTISLTAAEGSTLVLKTAATATAPPVYKLTPDAEHAILYRAAGAKALDRVILKNEKTGVPLIMEQDYTVTYSGNKTVAAADAVELPVMIIKGKGSYSGSIKVEFPIEKASLETMLSEESLKVTTSSAAFDSAKDKKTPEHVYQPAVTVKDGTAKLKGVADAIVAQDAGKAQGKDYTFKYVNCGQTAVSAYLARLDNKETPAVEESPHVIITALGDNYTGTIKVPLNLYRAEKKLTGNTLYVVVNPEQCIYKDDGTQKLTPEVRVYFGEAGDIKAAKNAKETDDGKLTAEKGSGGYGLTKLTESKTPGLVENGYTVTYGANNAAGNNKGSVTVTGTGLYGGSVTVKFKIGQKSVYKEKES